MSAGLSLLVPIVTMALALITKNAYFSLIVGIFFGSSLFCGLDAFRSSSFVFSVMEESLAGNNIKVIVFLVLLGSIVSLINKTGVSEIYADLIGKKVKTKRGVLLLTSFFSTIFFLDDYFNCLTTGNIVRPISEHKKIFPGRIAHVIHSTAIPICILVPISSWAAAISSTFTDSGASDGLSLFVRTIPYNFYALISLFSVLIVSIFDISFFTMKKEEIKFSKNSDSFGENNIKQTSEYINGGLCTSEKSSVKSFILKLVFPLLFLIVSCIFCLLYTGGITEGKNFLDSIANCDSSTGLLMGAAFSFGFMFLLYVVVLRIIKLGDFFNSISEGLKEMSGAIVVLVLAWSLGTLTSKYLKIGDLFANILKSNMAVACWIPLLLFAIAAVLSVATGTSWGTFAILIPVSFPVLQAQGSQSILLSSLAAILSGAAFGDNVSPISDTTIMASTSSGCNPLIHSFTQMPYAVVSASIASVCFLLAGFIQNVLLLLLVAVSLVVFSWFFIKKFSNLKST